MLAAEFCHGFLNDSAAAFLARDWPRPAAGQHAATLMAWLDRELADEQQGPDRELLRCIGLFDRPAPWGALMALKEQAPPIPGLTEHLHQADDEALIEALARLAQWGLIDAELSRTTPDPDAHPLVRERFGADLERDDPSAYRAAHRALFDWFRGLPGQQRPEGLEALEPLYRAMGHGCRAGAYWTALDEVYWDRIRRGEQGYSGFQLGAWSSDLAALSGFFPGGWGEAPVTGEGDEALTEANRSWLLGEVAFCLMSMGRMEEALGPRSMDRKMDKEAEDWNNYCISSNGLMDLLTPLGRWADAETTVREALEVVERIDDPNKRWQRTMGALAYLGRALHGLGRLDQALATFRRAEAVQSENMLETPWLYAPLGYDYAQLLLERACRPATWREILERGRYALEIAEKYQHILSQALDHCTIGQALAALGETDGDAGAGLALDRAVTTMQRAGFILFQPIALLARAHHLRHLADPSPAWQDHAAALAIALRGNMRTYLAECALLAAHLHLDANQLPEAAAEHAKAARLIREDGYARRKVELQILHARLLHHQADPSARTALESAQACIRDLGQWGHWRELRETGKEIGMPVPETCPAEDERGPTQ